MKYAIGRSLLVTVLLALATGAGADELTVNGILSGRGADAAADGGRTAVSHPSHAVTMM